MGELAVSNCDLPPLMPFIPQQASSNMLSTLPVCSSTSCCQWNRALAGSANVLILGFPLTVHSIPLVRRLTR